MDKEQEKVPITSRLKSLSVGQVATFPIEQLNSVRVICYRLRISLMRSGWDYKETIDKKNFTIRIERTH